MENYGVSSQNFTPDNLLYGDFPQVTEDVTIKSGEGVVKRGTVLGKITRDVPTTGDGTGNTGDGTMTAVTGKRYTKTGNYVATCIAVAVNAGTFKVENPDGVRLPDAEVGVAYVSDEIAFTINDGAADFIVGDKFTIAVSVGSRECVAVDSSNSDGSENPYAVLLVDVDATSSAIKSSGALSGDFNENALIFGGSDDIETHKGAMRPLGLYTHASQEFVPGNTGF